MRDSQVTHVGFSDESNWNVGRFRSLGLVTVPAAHLEDIETKLLDLLKESKLDEFKWKNLRGAEERFAALKMCEFAIEKALMRQLRVDVLIWDIEDRRHKVVGRDDIANLQRMYYHLFRNVLRLRWPDNAVWRLHPDEHTAMDWETVKDCLENVSQRVEVDRSLFTGGLFRVRLRKEFGLEEIVSVRSTDHPLLQLADLFCGLAVFSREKFDEYQTWLKATSNQAPLLGDRPDVTPSRSSGERFQVLKAFDKSCKSLKLGVSLKEKKGLWTPRPENPLNFWMYGPQHSEDKAPTRG